MFTKKFQTLLISALITMGVMAIVYRVPFLRNIVMGG